MRYVGAFGSSHTEPPYGHAKVTHNWLNNSDRWDFTNQARSGNWPWSNLVRLDDELLSGNAPEIVLCDFRSVSPGRQQASLEAIIRKIWTANPQARIISPIIPSVSGGEIAALDQQALDDHAMAAVYGVHMVDLRQAEIDLVAQGHLLTEYVSDGTHQTATGHALASSLEQSLITSSGLLSPENHSILPARIYDDGYYETTEPQRILGNANAGTTGTWNTTGTRIESSEENATVTFVVTCHSFGLYSAGTENSVCDVQIDGGAWQTNVAVTHNGNYFDDLADGEHTIVIRVRSGVAIRIDEFWAI